MASRSMQICATLVSALCAQVTLASAGNPVATGASSDVSLVQSTAAASERARHLASFEAQVEDLLERHHHHKHHHHHHKPVEEAPAPEEDTTESSTEASDAAPATTNSNANNTAALTSVASAVEPAAHMPMGTRDESQAPVTVPAAAVAMSSESTKQGTETEIVAKMRQLENELAKKGKKKAAPPTEGNIEAEVAEIGAMQKGSLEVNGPLPADFAERFAQAVSQASNVDPTQVHVLSAAPGPEADGEDVVKISFDAPASVIEDVEDQAANPESKLATGNLHLFLTAKDSGDAPDGPPAAGGATAQLPFPGAVSNEPAAESPEGSVEEQSIHEVSSNPPVKDNGAIDIDTQMPYGDLEPFGREDTAQELTEGSVRESNAMVDQLERAEVSEEKRAVFRALTRLRGAAITSFDGIARSQTGNIDEYNKIHKWRNAHPLHHLADEESDVSKWAFPDNADLLQTKHGGKGGNKTAALQTKVCGPQTKVCVAAARDGANTPLFECKVVSDGAKVPVGLSASKNPAKVCGPGKFVFSPMQCNGDNFAYKTDSYEVDRSAATTECQTIDWPYPMACYSVTCN